MKTIMKNGKFLIVDDNFEKPFEISAEKSQEFVDNLFNPVKNENAIHTLEKIEEFFKDKKFPFRLSQSEIDDFELGD